MPDWNRLVGVPLPSDFPADLLFDVHDQVTPRLRPEIFEHYGGAWNAIAYRSILLARTDEAFRNSIAQPYAMAERLEQEIAVFTFFAALVSGIEAVFYGLYAIGALWDPATFHLLPAKPRGVVPSAVVNAFQSVPSATTLASMLAALHVDPTYTESFAIRNFLSHRSAPGRLVNASTAGPMIWKLTAHGATDIPIDSALTSARRAWFVARVQAVLDATLALLPAWT
jgi:hypothetical protein